MHKSFRIALKKDDSPQTPAHAFIVEFQHRGIIERLPIRLNMDDELNKVIGELEGMLAVTLRSSRKIQSGAIFQEFGVHLAESVFVGRLHEALREANDEAQRQRQDLRIMLDIQAEELLGIPWEYMYIPEELSSTPPALNARLPLVRTVNQQYPSQKLIIDPPMRILGMVSQPKDYTTLDAAKEKERMDQSLAGLIEKGLVWIDWLETGSLSKLRAALVSEEYHLFHFVGHGEFDADRGEGYLLMENDEGKSEKVYGQELAFTLDQGRNLHIVFLNACETGRITSANPYGGVVSSLLKHNIWVAVAMQFPIPDDVAVEFAREFYQGLLPDRYTRFTENNTVQPGKTVEQAVALARLSLLSNDRYPGIWAFPVLYSRVEDTDILNFEFNPDKLTTRIHNKLRTNTPRDWEEAFNLCNLLAALDPEKDRLVRGLQAYARAELAKAKGDWARALEECELAEEELRFEREAKDYRENFLPRLQKEAESKLAAQEMLVDLYAQVQNGQLAEASDTCDRILERDRRNREAQIIRNVIRYEESLAAELPGLERHFEAQRWDELSEAVERIWDGRIISPLRELGHDLNLPRIRRLQDLMTRAELYGRLDKLIQNEDWKGAEAQARSLANQNLPLSPDRLVYIQARHDEQNGLFTAAMEKLQKIQETRDDRLYREVHTSLRRLEQTAQKLGDLQGRLSATLQEGAWNDALKICEEFLRHNPGSDAVKGLIKVLHHVIDLYAHFDDQFIMYPADRILTDFYRPLRSRGISSNSPQAAVQGAIQNWQRTSTNVGDYDAIVEALSDTTTRLMVDFLMIQGAPALDHLHDYITAQISSTFNLPEPDAYPVELHAIRPVIHAIRREHDLAVSRWYELLTPEAVTLPLLHNLMVFHYWQARTFHQLGRESEMLENWHMALGFWAVISHAPAYLNEWIEGRCRTYDVAQPTAEHFITSINETLLVIFEADERAFHHHHIDLLVEHRAAAAIALAGGLKLRDNLTLNVGTQVMRALHLERQVAEIARNTAPAALEVRHMFSQIGRVVVLLNEGFVAEAREYLNHSDCRECTLARRDGEPRLACAVCRYFDDLNVGYMLLDDRAALLAENAIQLLSDIHVETVIRLFKEIHSKPQEIAENWLAAVSSEGNGSAIQHRLVSAAEDAHKMLRQEDYQGNRLREIEVFSWLIDCLEAVLAVVDPVQPLSGKPREDFYKTLAACYGNRAIDNNNENRLEESEQDARRALELDPASASGHFALSYMYEKLSHSPGPPYLKLDYAREALKIAEAGLAKKPNESMLKRQVDDCRDRVEALGGGRQVSTPDFTPADLPPTSPVVTTAAPAMEAERSADPMPDHTPSTEVDEGFVSRETGPKPGHSISEQIEFTRQNSSPENVNRLLQTLTREVYSLADTDNLDQAKAILNDCRDIFNQKRSEAFLDLTRYVRQGYQQRLRVLRQNNLPKDDPLRLVHSFDESERTWTFRFGEGDAIIMEICGDMVVFSTYVAHITDEAVQTQRMYNLVHALHDIPLFQPNSNSHLGIGVAMVLPVENLTDELTVWCTRRVNEIGRLYLRPHIDNPTQLRNGFALFRDNLIYSSPIPEITNLDATLRDLCRDLQIRVQYNPGDKSYTLEYDRFYGGTTQVTLVDDRVISFSSLIIGAVLTTQHAYLQRMFQINTDLALLSVTLDSNNQIILKCDLVDLTAAHFARILSLLTVSLSDYDL